MKRFPFIPWIIVLLLLIILIYREFNRGGNKIPVDPVKLKEHVMSLDSAAIFTKSFAAAKQALSRQIQDSGYLNREFNLPVCEMFNKDAIGALLNSPGAQGVRIYLGLNPKKEVCFVLVPVTANGKDVRTRLQQKTAGLNIPGISSAMAQPIDDLSDEAIERGQRCPHICDFESPLDPGQ